MDSKKHSMNKIALLMTSLLIFLPQTQGEEPLIPGRPKVGAASRDVVPNTLGKLAAVQFGVGNEDAHIGLIRDGKVTSFTGSTLREAMNLALRPGDIVVANEYADSLVKWRNENPGVPISSSIATNIIGGHFFEVPATNLSQQEAESKSPTSLKGKANLPLPIIVAPKLTEPKTRNEDSVSATSEEPASSTPWSIIVVLIVAATGLLWLLLKKRN